MTSIHINCDMGESFGPYIKGNDRALMPLINACNIACGMHAGDPIHMLKTVQLAVNHNVEIGAHPGYPDIMGFGRRPMHYDVDDLKTLLYYQLGALQKIVEINGAEISHVKAHGALYNLAARDEQTAITIAEAVKQALPHAIIYAPANSVQLGVAQQMGMQYKIEAFIDRRYTNKMQLASRKIEGAVIDDENEALEQVRKIFQNKELITIESEVRTIYADTFCIHGDNPRALEIVQLIRSHL